MKSKYYSELLLIFVLCCAGYSVVVAVKPWHDVWQEKDWIERQANSTGWAEYDDYARMRDETQ